MLVNDAGVERTVAAYEKAHLSSPGGYTPRSYGFGREDVILLAYETSLLFRKAFRTARWSEEAIAGKRLLEVGSAWGARLQQVAGFGFDPEHLTGVDVVETFVAEARRLNPTMSFDLMSATQMAYPDAAFDASFAVMALSAMIDPSVIERSLTEMCRVSREFILVIDNFEPSYESRREGVCYFRGVDEGQIRDLARLPRVREIRCLGSFWTTSRFSWRLASWLGRLGLDAVAYAVAVRWLARHSHRAWLVRLGDGDSRR